MDVFGDYKYLFFMCGGVIIAGGIFLFIMNMYNYHMLEKENSLENQDEVNDAEEQTDLNEPEAVSMDTARQHPELEYDKETN